MTSTKVTAAHTCTAGVLFVLGILLLLHSQNIKADNGSGMINRAPMVKATPKPTELEKISTDLDDIIKSINDMTDEAEENTVTAEPEPPVEKVPAKNMQAPAPVIAKPKLPEPVEVKSVENTPVNIEAEPVLAKTVALPIPVIVAKDLKKSTSTTQNANTKDAYLKLSANGETLQSSTPNWDCVQDTNTGLTWEVKASNDGLRDKKHLYTWFDPSQNSGIADGGRCKGDINCDTNAYIQAVNQQKFCGHDDWRLPTREEMQSLVYIDNKNVAAKINREYFPETLPSWYWTASSNEKNPDYAWYVLFRNGISLNDLKARPKHIRLVRKDGNA